MEFCKIDSNKIGNDILPLCEPSKPIDKAGNCFTISGQKAGNWFSSPFRDQMRRGRVSQETGGGWRQATATATAGPPQGPSCWLWWSGPQRQMATWGWSHGHCRKCTSCSRPRTRTLSAKYNTCVGSTQTTNVQCDNSRESIHVQ